MKKINEMFNKIEASEELKERIIAKASAVDFSEVKAHNKSSKPYRVRRLFPLQRVAAAVMTFVLVLSVVFMTPLMPWNNNANGGGIDIGAGEGKNNGGDNDGGNNGGGNFGTVNGVLAPIQTSHEEIIELIKDLIGDDEGRGDGEDGSWDDKESDADAPGDSGDDYATTNVQEEGVDEGDIIKVDSTHIYTLSRLGLLIVNIENEMKVSYQEPFENFYPDELFIFGNKLIVIGGEYSYFEYNNCSIGEEPVPYWGYRTHTRIIVYDLNDRINVTVSSEYTITGNFVTSRMIDGRLIVYINYDIDFYQLASYFPRINNDVIDAKYIHLYKSGVFGSYLMLFSLDLNSYEMSFAAHFGLRQRWYGSVDYFSKNNLYSFVSLYEWEQHEGLSYSTQTAYTVIVKISLETLKHTASQRINGLVNDRYWASEHNGNLRVVSSSNVWESDSWRARRHTNVFVLDEGLEIIGSLTGIAKGENLHSVRFNGNQCTIATFIEINPLFIVDLTDPDNLTIKQGEREGGVNTYMQFLKDDVILGLGLNTHTDSNNWTEFRGMKVALYDNSGDVPKNVNNKDIGSHYVYSEALWNPKAILNDPARNMFSFPVTMQGQAYRSLEGQGLQVFEYNLNAARDEDKLIHKGFLTNTKQNVTYASWEDYYYDYFSYVKRGARIGSKIYTISERYITSYDINTLEQVQQLALTVHPCYFMHRWSNWSRIEATCTVDGTQWRTCSVCQGEQRHTLSACGHTFSNWAIDQMPTTNGGGTETRTCYYACGHKETRDLIDHVGINGLVLALNEDEDGVQVYHARTYSGTNTAVQIPAEFNGIPVIKIMDSAFYQSNIRSINISKNINTIGQSAFWGCTNLQTVTFESGSCLKTIENHAFSQSRLNNITLPNGVEFIGNNAFSFTGLSSITIPNSVKIIEWGAFQENSNLQTVTFEKGSQLEILQNQTFSKTKIVNVEIPASIKEIRSWVFSDASYQYIQFWSISSLRNVTFEEGSNLSKIGSNAFSRTDIRSITIPKSVETIDWNAFFESRYLNTATFEEESRLNSIGDSAFFSTALMNIKIPDSVISIGTRAFANLSSLNTVNIGEGSLLEYIHSNAFQNTNISSIHLPKNLISIGNNAFQNTNLSSVIIPSKVNSIQSFAFNGTKLKTVNIPASVMWLDGSAFSDISTLERLSVDSENPFYKSEFDCIIDVSKTILNGQSNPTEVISNTLVIGCSNSIIPDYITTIGNYAFMGSGIKSIVIPKNVEHIQIYAFANCSSLTKVEIEKESKLRTINSFAFSGTTKVSSFDIPVSVAAIAPWAFNGWTSTQTINVYGAATSYYATAKFGENWRAGCHAIINYSEL